jgi:hypothetical protein
MSFKFYARIKDSVLQQGYALDAKSLEFTKEQYPDEIFVEVNFLADPDVYYFSNGIVKKKPEKPSETSFWDEITFSWVENLQLKELEVKRFRNTLLSASDWTQLPDVTAETKQAWASYRQALRDIPDQPGYPTNIVWPTPPQ